VVYRGAGRSPPTSPITSCPAQTHITTYVTTPHRSPRLWSLSARPRARNPRPPTLPAILPHDPRDRRATPGQIPGNEPSRRGSSRPRSRLAQLPWRNPPSRRGRTDPAHSRGPDPARTGQAAHGWCSRQAILPLSGPCDILSTRRVCRGVSTGHPRV